MPFWLELLICAWLILGSLFALVGAIGLYRLPDFFTRLHGPTKASTLGVGCVLLVSVGYHLFTGTDPQPRELLITLFLFITAPVSAHILSKAAMQQKVELTERTHGQPWDDDH